MTDSLALDLLRALARRRDIHVWPNVPPRWEGDAPFLYRKGSTEVGGINAGDEEDALLALMPDLTPPGDLA